MAEWFYTDNWNRQYGPVDDDVLFELSQSGTIRANTSVWRDGMSVWAPFFDVAADVFGKDDAGNTPDLGICSHSGKVVRTSETIPYGNALIDVSAKQEFVQSLMETGRQITTDRDDTSKNYVGFWWRLLGIMLDEMVKYGIVIILMLVLGLIFYGITSAFGIDSIEETFSGFFVASFMFVTVGAGALYEIIMVGKYQGTLGKLVLGAKVVQPDNSRVTYKRSIGRWLAKCPIFLEGIKVLPLLIFVFFIGLVSKGFQSGSTAFLIASWFLAFAIPTILSIVITSVFWMAAFDSQKRALHDRITSTRVVPKL